MPYVRRLRIEGLAGREDVCQAELNEYVNVFFGANGSGKTSLLRILHSALDDNAESVREVPFTRAEVVVYSYGKKKEITYTLDKNPDAEFSQQQLIEGSSGEDDQSTFVPIRKKKRKKLTWKTDPIEVGGWFHKYLPISRLYARQPGQAAGPYYSFGSQPDLSAEGLEAQFSENLTQSWKDYSADLGREVNKAQEAGLARILESVISRSESYPEEGSFDPREAYQAVSNFMSRRGMSKVALSESEFLNRYKTDQQLRSVAKDIEAVEKRISQVTAPRDQFRDLVNQMFIGGKALSFSDKELEIAIRDKTISLSTLSSGEKQLLTILVNTLIAGTAVILVDEPELSLHVDWQRRLVSTMRTLNPRPQIIMATHSPEIMAELPDEQIFPL